jgi:hypothetical protein
MQLVEGRVFLAPRQPTNQQYPLNMKPTEEKQGAKSSLVAWSPWKIFYSKGNLKFKKFQRSFSRFPLVFLLGYTCEVMYCYINASIID